MGLSLAEEDVARLEERTEGWVTGLQLAALSMQGRHDLSSFIQAFRGNHRFVLDYLAEEVLQQQPGNIQNFLLETSLLDRLSAPLVEAVTGISGGQALLEQLEHGNLFLVRLDDERRWYRYHHLFADFLRNRLQQTQPERVAEVHRRAAKWFEQNNLPEQGVSHALAGRDFEQAALLLENIAQAMLMRGELTTLLGWIQALPPEAVRVRPHLGVYYAGTLMATGQLESAEAYLAEIESYLSSRQEVERSQAEIIRGEMAAIQALIVTSRGELARTLELGHKALQRLPPESHFFRGIAAWALGATSYMTGDLVEGKKALSESMRTGYASGNLLVALLSGYTLGFLHVMEGRLHQAQQIYEQTMQMVQPVVLTPDKVSRPMPFVSICYAGIGDLKREWNELEEAERYLKEAIEWGKQFPNLGILLDSFIFQARLKRALEDWPAAFEAIRQAEQVVAENESSPWDALQVQAHKARIWLALGNLAAANSWAEQRYGVNASSDLVKVGKATTKTADKIFPGLLGEMETTTLTRLRIAQGRPQEALELLKQLQTEAEASGRNGSLIEFLSLQALAFEGLGEGQQALVALGRALALAEPEGYVRLFLDEGQPMRDLLAKFAEAQHANTLAKLPPVPASYLQKLLSAVRPDLTNQAFEAVSSPTPGPQPLTPLIEPLTERELTVLRLLSDGKSNQEIAQALVVELSTAKWHLNNLYGKLGVRSRTQALARAKELSLL
jgi:LuxR family maltose regulon positive regulatory protein